MPSPHRRVLTAAVVATVLLVPLAGCGNDEPKATPATFATMLISAMQKERTAKLQVEFGTSISATADVDYAPGGTEVAMTISVGPQDLKVVLAGDAMYLQQTEGKKYLKITKDDPMLGSVLGKVASIGPKAALSGLKSGITKLDDRGTETVGGESLTHYVVVVDTARSKDTFGALTANAELPKTLTYDVYVDSDFLLREVKMDIGGQKSVMKVSDWGKPVTIKVPPPSQVMTRPSS